jgi:hypothetical protein
MLPMLPITHYRFDFIVTAERVDCKALGESKAELLFLGKHL